MNPCGAAPALTIEALVSGYGDLRVIDGLDLTVAAGSTVAVLGVNGAGKTALLHAIAGLNLATAGTIRHAGHEVTALTATARAKRGVRLVAAQRHLFAGMSVIDHLRLAAESAPASGAPRAKRAHRRATVEDVLAVFSRLDERRSQRAETMSGGEQQMVALARALVANPTLLLLDEPSAGLAPATIDELYRALTAWRERRDVTLIIAEQQPTAVLAMADRAVVIDRGSLVADSLNSDMPDHTQLWHWYAGNQRPGPREVPR